MPKEHKNRGRREDKKRKRMEEESNTASKKTTFDLKNDREMEIDLEHDNVFEENSSSSAARPGDMPFYGLLDEDEQEYFKRADSILELNQFADAEERHIFLANVYKETRGKELKLANSQSCSRLMERLILMSTPDQLKALFQKFSGHFLHLSQHRFASHCCESLFLQAAPVVSQELVAPLHEQHQENEGEDFYVTMENLFLYTLNELEGNLGYLMTDPFASHTLRVLLLVLSGRPLSGTITTSLYKSKKKENISVMARNANVNALMTTSRTVPDSFLAAVDKIISDIVLGLDTTTLRALATHPIGNPILQLMLELELSSSGKQKAKKRDSLFRKLIPDEKAEEDNLFSFVKNLAYDAVGSRLLEVIIRFAPGKTFRSLYSTIFKGKLDVFAKNDIAGFVVIQLLNRLSKEDLMHAVEQLCPQIGLLVERSRTSIITTLIERCRVRKVNTGLILDALQEAYGTDPARRLLKILQFDVNNTSMMAEDRKMQFENQAVGSVHGSLLAQSMLDTPGQLRELIIDGLLTTETSTLISMSKDRSASHVLQSSLAYSDQSHKFRRILIQRFFGHLRDLGTHSIASHVVDAFWAASVNLPFIRERVAIELQENEIELRESFAGKVVWRNWMMDKYKTRKSEWMAEARRNDEGGKSGLELARERFAAVSGKGSTKKRVKTTRRIQTGANDVVVGTETIH